MIKEEKALISIVVKFFADLREYGPNKENIHVPAGSTIKSILQKYKIPENKQNIIILVNGTPYIPKNYRVQERDVIAIFPPIAGG
jgi:molybdopterin converting factor small subunit